MFEKAKMVATYAIGSLIGSAVFAIGALPVQANQAQVPGTYVVGYPAWIGVQTDQYGEFAQITGIVPGSPADKAGFECGDDIFGLRQPNISGFTSLDMYRPFEGPWWSWTEFEEEQKAGRGLVFHQGDSIDVLIGGPRPSPANQNHNVFAMQVIQIDSTSMPPYQPRYYCPSR